MKLIETQKPMCDSFVIMGGPKNRAEFVDTLTANKSVRIKVDFETKTRLAISVQSGSSDYGINFPSKYAKDNNLEFVSKTEWNYLSGEQINKQYFKLKKKQGKPELFKHIESLIESYVFIVFGLPKELLSDLTVYVEMPDSY